MKVRVAPLIATAALAVLVAAAIPGTAKAVAKCPNPQPAGTYCAGGTARWADNNETDCVGCTIYILNRRPTKPQISSPISTGCTSGVGSRTATTTPSR